MKIIDRIVNLFNKNINKTNLNNGTVIIGNSSCSIAGKEYKGNNITTIGNKIIIDGVVQPDIITDSKVSIIVNGNCDSVSSTAGNIKLINCKKISTVSGNVDANDISGNVDTVSGDINCHKVSGNVSTMSGDIKTRK